MGTLQQNWSVQVTRAAWSRALAPLPVEVPLLPVVEAEPEIRPSGPKLGGWATHYGESYAGGVLACGTGFYDSGNATILAVGPSRDGDWPCGTLLEVCGPAGCAIVERQDACPGCGPNVLDLSEAGNELVCGAPPHTCRATMQKVQFVPGGEAQELETASR